MVCYGKTMWNQWWNRTVVWNYCRNLNKQIIVATCLCSLYVNAWERDSNVLIICLQGVSCFIILMFVTWNL